MKSNMLFKSLLALAAATGAAAHGQFSVFAFNLVLAHRCLLARRCLIVHPRRHDLQRFRSLQHANRTVVDPEAMGYVCLFPFRS